VAGSRGFAILGHLIEVVGDAIYFPGRIVDRRGCAIGGLGRFVSGVERLSRGLLGAGGGLF